MSPRLHGQLSLHFTEANVSTQLHVIKQTPPLRVIRAFQHPNGAALVHLHNVSGGVLGGDQLELAVQLDPSAQVQLTTPSATRVYRHRADRPTACQHTQIKIGAKALLEYLPDPVIPFAQARYQQQTEIHLAEGAGLFWWEIVAPGREAKSEFLAYDYLETHVDIWANQRPIALERQRFCPAQQRATSPLRLGHYGYMTTFYICQVGVLAATWTALEQELAALAPRLTPSTLWGISTLVRDGLVIRGLSHQGRELMKGLIEFWRVAKQYLYKTEIYLPRKIY